MTEQDETGEPPSRAEVENALGRIFAQTDTGLGTRARAFLQFIVQESLDGRAGRLKAFTIAMAVFGRDADFDPQTNSIVRVEATRLRRWLERYYDGAGADDPVVIRIPRGSYAPEFLRRRSAAPAPADDEEEFDLDPRPTEPVSSAVTPVTEPIVRVAAAEASPAPLGPPPRTPIFRRFALAGAIALGVVCFAWWSLGHRLPPSVDDLPVGSIRSSDVAEALRPSVTVAIDASTGDVSQRQLAAALQSETEIALSRFDTLTVVDADPSTEAGAVRRADYRLSGNIIALAEGRARLALRLAQAKSSAIVWSAEFSSAAGDLRMENVGSVVRDIVSALAPPGGVIAADLLQRGLRGDLAAGPNCFAGAADGWETLSPERRQAHVQCLTDLVQRDPAFAPAYARLAELHVGEYTEGASQSLALADAAARRAVALAPQSADAQAALFQVEFAQGQFDEALRIGRRALDLNPLEIGIMARLGAAYVARGEFDRALPLLRAAAAANPASPGWLGAYLFLAAHQRGDVEAERAAMLAGEAADHPLGLLARILVEDARGEDGPRQRDIDRFLSQYPVLGRDIRAALGRYGLAPAMVDRLVAELHKAGLGDERGPT